VLGQEAVNLFSRHFIKFPAKLQIISGTVEESENIFVTLHSNLEKVPWH
jgi:hypothetical protein